MHILRLGPDSLGGRTVVQQVVLHALVTYARPPVLHGTALIAHHVVKPRLVDLMVAMHVCCTCFMLASCMR